MKTIRLCPGCGAPLTNDAPGGLCPQCLLKTQVITDEERQSPPTHAMPVPGQRFGDYEILRLLGHGGMGEVFEAEHVNTGRRVALKVMRHTLGSEQDRKRFLREGRLAASVNHPNVVYIHGSEEIEGAPVIAMELVHDGTLKDRLKREGPLPISEAIEYTLQIISGLEAAHANGVLHRDIKPANCFIAADGTVKVGDFGLSVSTLARGESLITASGSVLGTPAYASPEQLRGEEADVKSDIYSLGATLYHLLTGKTPFQANDFVKLITEVLDKDPTDPRTLRPELPDDLAKVLLRCLAKDRGARFQSYLALRDALLPFRAQEFTPASPGMRFLASLVDDVISYMPIIPFFVLWGVEPLERWQVQRDTVALLFGLGVVLWQVGYYTVSEGLWGAGPGKALCGLRVIRTNGDRPGLWRATVRGLLFETPFFLPAFIYAAMVSREAATEAAQAGQVVLTDWLWLVLLLTLFSTMRRRNGFAALHDLASGTRVIVRPKTQPRPVLTHSKSHTPIPSPSSILMGPYQLQAKLWECGQETLWLAFDPALRRAVWVHVHPGNIADGNRRDLSRAARLHWLDSGHAENRVWEAYDAPEGVALLSLRGTPQSWAAVRYWLLDLAEECLAGLHKEGELKAGLERVWITRSGRAVLLDFPAPGISETNTPPIVVRNEADAQAFLSAVARVALDGENVPVAPSTIPLKARVPLHASGFLHSLFRGAFEKLEVVVGNLHSLAGRPAEITRARRAASLGVLPGALTLIGLLTAATVVFESLQTDRQWAAAHPTLPPLRHAADVYLENAANAPESRDTLLIRAYVGRNYATIITNDVAWKHFTEKANLDENARYVLKHAVASASSVAAEDAAEAERLVPRWISRTTERERLIPLFLLLGMFLLGFTLWTFVELGAALVLGRNLWKSIFGIALVNRQGQPASRGRLLVRWLVQLVQLIALWGAAGSLLAAIAMKAFSIVAASAIELPDANYFQLGWLFLPATAIAVGLLAQVRRGLADRIAGTWPVMR